MESSSLCEKNKIELWEKLKKSLLKTLLKNSPFDMKVLTQKHVEKILREIGKTGSKTSPKSYIKLAKTALLNRVQKYSRWGQICRPDDLSVDWPVDRPTVIFFTFGATV